MTRIDAEPRRSSGRNRSLRARPPLIGIALCAQGGDLKPHSRAVMAFIAGRLISGRNSSSVYDYGASAYRNIGGEVSPERVRVYDYVRSCHIGGDFDGSKFQLYDYGDSAHINLEIDGDQFKGYDFGTSSHFSGKVNGNSVSLYDYGSSSYFNYSV